MENIIGGVGERLKPPVLKTGVPHGTASSNLAPSAKISQLTKHLATEPKAPVDITSLGLLATDRVLDHNGRGAERLRDIRPRQVNTPSVHLNAGVPSAEHRSFNRDATARPIRLCRVTAIVKCEPLRQTGALACLGQLFGDHIAGDLGPIFTKEDEIRSLHEGDFGSPTLTTDVVKDFTRSGSEWTDLARASFFPPTFGNDHAGRFIDVGPSQPQQIRSRQTAFERDDQ